MGFVDDPVVRAACEHEARAFGVIADVHPKDFTFDHFLEKSGKPRDVATHYYFAAGAKSAGMLAEIAKPLGLPARPRILEFASGYGCVTRHLRNQFPDAEIVACDIDREMMTFVNGTLGVETALSSTVPEALAFERPFDLVFALSFFSHMPRSTFFRWMKRLNAVTTPGGLVLFTAHGRISRPHLNNPKLDREGYWFDARREHPSLFGATYGMTISLPDFVKRRIESLPDAELVAFREGLWWEHQDAYVLRRTAATHSVKPRRRIERMFDRLPSGPQLASLGREAAAAPVRWTRSLVRRDPAR